MSTPLLEALEEHAAVLRAATQVYVGFSGGTDSHCLLHALMTLSQNEPLPPVTAIHVNHGLHADADAWEMQCRKMAGELGVDIVIERVAVKSEPSVEAQARAVRYDIFQKYLTENTLLLLAHHLDDQVETVLFRLIRGAGSAGLSGIPKTRQVGAGSLLRPFLGIHRSEIEAYASELGLKSISDPSNDDLALDRNFLRHQVLPMIEARWPGYRSGISRTAQIMGSVDDASTDAWYQCPFGCPSLDVDFREAETLHAAVHAKLKAMGLDLPAFDALKELSRQCLNAGRDKTPTLYTDAYALSCWRGRLQILPATIAPCEPEETVVGRAISRAWGSLTWVVAKTGLPEGSQVSLRPIDEGERVRFPGRPSRPIRHGMQEKGIAPYWRASVPTVCVNADVMAVAGLGCTDQCAHIFNENSEGLVPIWTPPKIRIGN